MHRNLFSLLSALILAGSICPLASAQGNVPDKNHYKFVKVDAGKAIMTAEVELDKKTMQVSLPLSDKLKIAGGNPKVTKVEDIKKGSTMLISRDADGKVTFIYIIGEPEKPL